MMTDWYQKSMNALALNGKAGRTQEAYSRALRMLCEYYGNKQPQDIGETELEAYFLHRRNVDHWSATRAWDAGIVANCARYAGACRRKIS